MRQAEQLGCRQPRQLLLTASPNLAAALKRHCSALTATLDLVKQGGSGTRSPRQPAQDHNLLDAYAVRQELQGLPPRLDQLEPSHFPLVLSFDMLLELMDKQLPVPFRDAMGLQAGHGPVSVTTFTAKYWPHLHSGLKQKAGSAALVWAEMSACIKGSIEAMKSAQGRLALEQYVALGHSRRGAALDTERRAAIYSLHLQYEKLKGEAREWDFADMAAYVSRGWGAPGGEVSLPPAKQVDFLYVDEVQDCCMGLLHLLRSHPARSSSMG